MSQKRGLSKNSPPSSSNANMINQQVPDDLKIILQKLAPEEQKTIIKSIHYSYFQAHIGPLPAPESLELYNKTIPDGAERIMRMAENQSNHRIKIEENVINGQIKQSGRGQIFGLIIAFITIGSSVALAMFGHDVVAGVLGGGTVVGLVTVFVIGKREQKEQLAEKRPDFKNPK